MTQDLSRVKNLELNKKKFKFKETEKVLQTALLPIVHYMEVYDEVKILQSIILCNLFT